MDRTKRLVRSVLMSSKEGVPAHRFKKDFRDLTTDELNPREFGFNNIEDFMISMRDVVRVSRIRGEVTFHAVETVETQHIKSLIANQKSKRKKPKKLTFKWQAPVQRHERAYQRSYQSTAGWSKRTVTYSSKQQSVSKPRSLIRPPGQNASTVGYSKIYSAMSSVSNPRSLMGLPAGTVNHPKANTAPPRKISVKKKSAYTDVSGKLSPVILNRIKSVLGSNPGGVHAQDFQKIYFKEHKAELSDSIMDDLINGTIKGTVRVGVYPLKQGQKYILYPLKNEDCRSQSTSMQKKKCDERKFSMDPHSNVASISATIRKQLTQLLSETKDGMTFCDLKNAYMKRYRCQISDTILHAVECGQVHDVAIINRQCIGNREFVKFYPIPDQSLVSAMDELTINRRKEAFGIPSKCKDIVSKIITSNTAVRSIRALGKGDAVTHKVDLTRDKLSGIESRTPEIKPVAKSDVGTAQGSPKRKIAKALRRKYPAVPSANQPMGDGPTGYRSPKKMVLEQNSLHSGKVTHVCDENGAYFYVQIFQNPKFIDIVDNIQCGKNDLVHGDIEPGLLVVCNGKRGKVVTISRSLVMVYFMDFGYTVGVSYSELYHFQKHLYQIPQLAVLCTLDKQNYDYKHFKEGCRKTLPTLLNKKVITKVVSTSVGDLSGKSRVFHAVHCYHSGTNVNCEIMESVKMSSTEDDVDSTSGLDKYESDSSVSSSISSLSDEDDCLPSVSPEDHIKVSETVGELKPHNSITYVNPPKSFFYQGVMGKLIVVEITRVLWPDLFMVPVERLVHLQNITSMMTQYFLKSDSKCCNPTRGDKGIYAAICDRYTRPIWRRVEVRSVIGKHTSVYLVDRGEVDVVPTGSLRCLPPHITVLPKLVMVGRLGGISIKDSLSLQARKRFEDVITDHPLTAHVVDCFVENNLLVYDICVYRDDGKKVECVNDVMVEEWKVADYVTI